MKRILTTRVRKSLATFKMPRSYKALLERVRATLEAARGRAREVLAKIESRMFWETGRWIHLYLTHEKQTPGRAPYGEKVVTKLAQDLKYDKNYLYDALKVYRNNPIFRTYGKLAVALHRALLQVKDEGERKALAAQAQKEGWSRRELLLHIQAPPALPVPDGHNLPLSAPTGALRARRGKLQHHRIVERHGRLFLDLGFRDFRALEGRALESGNLKDGDIVEGAAFEQLTKKPDAGKADLYTYRAEVLHCPDADTYWLFIHKGFGGFREDKIRLRGIDAPEMNTPEGRAAKAFVEALLTLPAGKRKPGGDRLVNPIASPFGGTYREILITTTKTPDKWDRYLVDLYFEKDGREIYLNRLLLESGHAVPYVESDRLSDPNPKIALV